jgi:hypothetical protein
VVVHRIIYHVIEKASVEGMKMKPSSSFASAKILIPHKEGASLRKSASRYHEHEHKVEHTLNKDNTIVGATTKARN